MIDKFINWLEFHQWTLLLFLFFWGGFFGFALGESYKEKKAVEAGVGFYAPTNAQFYFKNLNN